MNHCVHDWNFEGDLHVTNQKKPIGPDHELVELLWRNGQVVLNSQTQRRHGHHDVARQDQASLSIGSYGNASHLIQDGETVSWIHNPLEDCFGKEFCSSLFTDLPSLEPIHADKAPPIKQLEVDKFVKFSTPNPTHVVAPLQQQQQHQQPNSNHSALPELHGNLMPPPRFQLPGSAPRSNNVEVFARIADFGKVALSKKVDIGVSSGQLGGKGSDTMTQGKARECSAMTVGSSLCGSNQFLNDPDWSRISSSGVGTTGLSARPFKDNLQKEINPSGRGQTDTFEPTLTSSSGGSGSSFGRTCRQSSGFTVHKRKGTDAEESASPSEAAELESASGNKSSRSQSGGAKRSRAAEVHNQSERRRRDRINEKMKALQELIPHCSKTDKASMLDEAIEYLKSLQLQLQVMWMGGGMGPMMFPGVQHYMSRMSMGVGSSSLASLPSTSLPRLPLINQSMSVAQTQTPNQAVMCQTPVMNPVNYPNQMQNASLPEQYARYLGFHHQMQTTPQPMNMNMFRFSPQAIQQSHPIALPASGIVGTFSGGAATNDALSRKTCH